MTERRSSRARVRTPLTDLEHDVMRVVWTSGPCSVEAVHQVVARTRDVKETTVRTLLRRLEQKGYLRHEIDGAGSLLLRVRFCGLQRFFFFRSVATPRYGNSLVDGDLLTRRFADAGNAAAF